MVNEMGGAAPPISFGELYTALQQGVVDGAENNPPSFHLTNHYELCDYYSLDKHTAPQDVLLVSTHLWERLTPQQRTWLQEAADESAQYQKKLWQNAVAFSIQPAQLHNLLDTTRSGAERSEVMPVGAICFYSSQATCSAFL